MKKIVGIVLVIFAISFLTGCENKQTNSSEKNDSIVSVVQEDKKQETQTIDNAIEKLKVAGFSAGQKNEAYYQMIGAYDGTKININDINVEIYQYNEAQKDAKKNAKETMETADSIIFENNSLLIVVHSKDTEFIDNLKNALK
ncbi:MAG: hypothetical protein A2271_02390 [Candidatus Moranbacteria bacterium RIFOXYA12_FULL_35_19]|nr:MAG: hypothetical protein UR78_C0008G0026 [Candidatus Moranbacteria bacterium GW2011_GWF2_35_39]OGI31924.1 MAG: hypothetical protein A2343_00900 [Candidatus Moranbacteria bacterium RIFOXYB12_FULL_35_8]OGI35388.1 MAG: hypothetical protein A2271_02390 [Candidatus Moranbacteria bacterium RIFOXYA12_FULL_35_19]